MYLYRLYILYIFNVKREDVGRLVTSRCFGEIRCNSRRKWTSDRARTRCWV